MNYLKTVGFPDAKRMLPTGSKDVGDVEIRPGLIAEVKNYATWSRQDLLGWIEELDTEKEHYHKATGWRPTGIVVVKKRGAPLGHWLAAHRGDPSGIIAMFYLVDYLREVRRWEAI